MSPIQNIHFSLLIRVSSRIHEFNFRKRKEEYYDVDTSDERGTRHYFKIERQGGGLTLKGSGIPVWIIDNSSVILESLESSGQNSL